MHVYHGPESAAVRTPFPMILPHTSCCLRLGHPWPVGDMPALVSEKLFTLKLLTPHFCICTPCPLFLTGGHFKPWEAMLLMDTLAYVHQHFVAPPADALPRLRRVRCLALRLPAGALDREVALAGVANRRSGGGASDASGARIGGGEERRGEEAVAAAAAAAVMGAPCGSYGGWSVRCSERRPVTEARAGDGLEVDTCDLVFERV